MTTATQPVLVAQAALDHIEFSAVIMPDVTMKGDIHSPSKRTVAIMGTLIGNVEAGGPVFVFPNAKIHGNITAPEARLMGEVTPQTDHEVLTVKVGFCHLGKDGYVKGNVEYGKIVIEDGCRGIDGTMKSVPIETLKVETPHFNLNTANSTIKVENSELPNIAEPSHATASTAHQTMATHLTT